MKLWIFFTILLQFAMIFGFDQPIDSPINNRFLDTSLKTMNVMVNKLDEELGI